RRPLSGGRICQKNVNVYSPGRGPDEGAPPRALSPPPQWQVGGSKAALSTDRVFGDFTIRHILSIECEILKSSLAAAVTSQCIEGRFTRSDHPACQERE